VNIGSGVSAIKFTSKDTYTRVGGTSLGGGIILIFLVHLFSRNFFGLV